MTYPNPLPDPMPLRDALRGLRHAVRRAGETFLDAMPVGSLPRPAADLAGVVLREVTGIAKGVNDMASGLARIALGPGERPTGSWQGLTGGMNDADAFATGIYAALRSVLRRLGAPSAYVSETAARTAYLDVGHDPNRSAASTAAALSLTLVAAKVLRGATAEDAGRVPGFALDHVALFAVMLWLQSDRAEVEDEAALDAATDLAIALAPEADLAFRRQDAMGLETLYAEFAAHV